MIHIHTSGVPQMQMPLRHRSTSEENNSPYLTRRIQCVLRVANKSFELLRAILSLRGIFGLVMGTPLQSLGGEEMSRVNASQNGQRTRRNRM